MKGLARTARPFTAMVHGLDGLAAALLQGLDDGPDLLSRHRCALGQFGQGERSRLPSLFQKGYANGWLG